MTDYTSLSKIKKALVISLSETEWDDELRNIRDNAEAVIDLYLGDYVSTPLTSVPSIVENVCTELVRVEYRKRRAPDEDALNILNKMAREALELLQKYVDKTYSSQNFPPFYVGKDTSGLTS